MLQNTKFFSQTALGSRHLRFNTHYRFKHTSNTLNKSTAPTSCIKNSTDCNLYAGSVTRDLAGRVLNYTQKQHRSKNTNVHL